MGIYDRNYTRQSGPGFFGQHQARVTKILVVLNLFVFLLNGVFTGAGRGSGISPFAWGCFSVEKAIEGFQIWRFITYQFNHLDFWHFAFNMLLLYRLGTLVENWMGSRRFLAFYLLSGIGGALLMSGFVYLPVQVLSVGVETPIIGASGGIMACIAAVMVFMPNMVVRLWLMGIEARMITIGWVLLGVAFLTVLSNGQNAGGEAAHLGGALLGWMFCRNPQWLKWTESGISVLRPSRRKKFRVVNGGKPASPRCGGKPPSRREVDAVLDKIAKSGIGSLSKGEREVLEKARKDL